VIHVLRFKGLTLIRSPAIVVGLPANVYYMATFLQCHQSSNGASAAIICGDFERISLLSHCPGLSASTNRIYTQYTYISIEFSVPTI